MSARTTSATEETTSEGAGAARNHEYFGSELINTCVNRQDALHAVSHNTTHTCHATPKGLRHAFGCRARFACERFHKPVPSSRDGGPPGQAGVRHSRSRRLRSTLASDNPGGAGRSGNRVLGCDSDRSLRRTMVGQKTGHRTLAPRARHFHLCRSGILASVSHSHDCSTTLEVTRVIDIFAPIVRAMRECDVMHITL